MKKLLFLLAVMLIAVGMCVAQSSATGSSGTNNQNSAATSSSNNANQGATSADQTTGTAGQSSADQTGAAANGKAKSGKLPQTASPLPLLAILGMGSLGTGLINRFRK